jgi:phage terminase large subunit-like protein
MSANKFIRLLQHPFKFRLYLLWKLPAAFFSGVRLRVIDELHCEVTVPYKWFSQNPFRSTYFACLAMAAEMSSGLLALVHINAQAVKVSSLVVKFEAEYMKKAVARTWFVCNDGMMLKAAIEKAIASGEPQTFASRSVGKNEQGETVAECVITWSFKAK